MTEKHLNAARGEGRVGGKMVVYTEARGVSQACEGRGGDVAF